MSAVVVVLLGLLIVGLFALVSAANGAGEARMQQEVTFPILLRPEIVGEGGNEASGWVTLERDGMARLTDFPIGEVGNDGRKCSTWDGESTFSGEATWVIDNDMLITISAPSGQVVIGPYHPARGKVVWYRFGIPLCEGVAPLWYRAVD